MVEAMLRPTSLAELSEAIQAADSLWIHGAKSHTSDRIVKAPPVGSSQLDMTGLGGIVSYSPSDLVATVWGGTTLAEVQEELARHGQTLAIHDTGTLGGSVSANQLAQALRWQDVLLGATFVLADGTVAKAGSKAVKSVSGYDVHKLAVGARGTLAIVAQVTVRVTAITKGTFASHEQKTTESVLTEIEQRLMRRAKDIFDPTHKLNPGEMGIF